MKLMNLNVNSLEDYLNFSEILNMDSGFDKDGSLRVLDTASLRQTIVEVQRNCFQKRDTKDIQSKPPFEFHPYIELDTFPEAKHKTLLIGTFPPPSYLLNQYSDPQTTTTLKALKIDLAPQMNYFYGNRGYLWDLMEKELQFELITQFLDEKNVFISDIIMAAQRRSYNSNRASDNNLTNIVPNFPLVKNLATANTNIENIIFTSKSWDVKDGKGQGRRPRNYIPASISFSENMSAVSLFLRTFQMLGIELAIRRCNENSAHHFIPNCYDFFKQIAKEDFAFFLVVNGKEFLLQLGDSPSKNAFTPFDSSTFKKWIKWKHGDFGLQILNKNPRNSKNMSEKRARKTPIQEALGYDKGEDIGLRFLQEMYTCFFDRDHEKCFDIIGQ